MARRQYYVIPRKPSGIYYFIRTDPVTNETMDFRSTGTRDEKKAEAIAQEWLINGTPDKPKKTAYSRTVTFCDYLMWFWDFENSDYFKDLKNRHKDPNPEHPYEMQGVVNRYYRPYFKDKLLIQMNEPLLTDFINYLLNEKKLAESTVNSTRNAAIKALKYAKKKKLIPNLDFEEIPRAGDISKERGVLTRKEVDALFGLEWPSIRSRIASLIAAYTGMRMGEIRSLRVCDIHSGYIDVKHGWGKKRGRKETKNQEVRQIPILPKVSAEIQGYIQQRGLKEPGDLLLPGKNPLVPYNNRQIGKDFNKMLEKIGIDDKTRKERGIVFHSWRHRMAKTLAENNTPKDIGKKILGHKTDRMYDHYASHCNDETLKIEEKYINLAFRQDMPEKEVPPLHGAV